MKSIALLSALAVSASAASLTTPNIPKVSYDGYKVFRIPVGDDVDKVNSLIEKLKLETWQPASRPGAYADVVVAPDQLDAFNKQFKGMDMHPMHHDLGASILEESAYEVYAAGTANSTWFQSYHPYKDHLQWLKDMQSQYSGHAEVVTSGKSLQGNAITGLHFYGSGKGKPAIVFHGTVHAREWIATMTVEYMADQLLSKYDSDAETKSLLDKYDFYFFPVVNPDGFIYTQTTDRMWRKNRQTTQGSRCLGHDINRNWPYQWDVEGGASDDPCDEAFRGSSAGDTPEMKSLTAWLKQTQQAQGIKLYIDFHSYSQLFMTPYGYSCTAHPENDNELQSLARGAVSAIRAVHGTSFKSGPICSTIYPASGSSVDYVTDVVGGDYSFAVELRDTGRYGFVLPPSQIVPSGEETLAGIKYLLKNMK